MKILKLTAGLLVPASFFIAVSAPAMLWSKPAKLIKSTEVVNFTPPVVTGKALFAQCFAHSAAVPYRDDAWRCMVGNRIYDPCFSRNNERLVCAVHPIKQQMSFPIELVKPLPAEVLMPSTKPKAWIVQLEDNSFCEPQTGTLPLLNAGKQKIALSHYCYNPKIPECLLSAQQRCTQTGLSLDSLRVGPTWTAAKVTYVLDKASKQAPIVKKVERVNIIKVWQ